MTIKELQKARKAHGILLEETKDEVMEDLLAELYDLREYKKFNKLKEDIAKVAP